MHIQKRRNENEKDNTICWSILNRKRGHHRTNKLPKPRPATFPLIAILTDHAKRPNCQSLISLNTSVSEKEVTVEFKMSIFLGRNHIIAKPILVSQV